MKDDERKERGSGPVGRIPNLWAFKVHERRLFSYRISESAGIRNFSGLKEQVRTTLTEASDLPRPAHPLHEHGRQILRDVTVSFLFVLRRQMCPTFQEHWVGRCPHKYPSCSHPPIRTCTQALELLNSFQSSGFTTGFYLFLCQYVLSTMVYVS